MIPLATRMRPLSLEEFVGQEHFLYKGSLLYNSIKIPFISILVRNSSILQRFCAFLKILRL